MIRFNMRRVLAGLALCALAGSATAQSYPSHPIKLIVSYSVGGPTDAVARIAAERLSERLGQSVVVQTVLGNGGIIGTEAAARAKPDGYTLYFGVNSMAIFPNIRPEGSPLGFDPLDFVALGGVAESAHVLLASKESGFKSVADLVSKAKQLPPDSITYGSAGVGGTSHLPLAFFANEAGIQLLHVPYKGAAPAFVDLLAGRISLSTPGYSGSLTEPIESGKVTALAVTSAERLPFLPNVPTLAESGYPTMVFPIWYGLFAPKGTPQEVVDRISKELKEMAQEPAYAQKLAAQGNVAKYVSPKDLHAQLAKQTREIGERIRAAGLTF